MGTEPFAHIRSCRLAVGDLIQALMSAAQPESLTPGVSTQRVQDRQSLLLE